MCTACGFLRAAGARVGLACAALLVTALTLPVLAIGGVLGAVLALAGVTRAAGDVLLIDDMALNVALLGRAGETVSHRTARLREWGGMPWRRLGRAACAALTWCGRRLGATEDHCTWSLEGGDSIGGEVWRWSKCVVPALLLLGGPALAQTRLSDLPVAGTVRCPPTGCSSSQRQLLKPCFILHGAHEAAPAFAMPRGEHR